MLYEVGWDMSGNHMKTWAAYYVKYLWTDVWPYYKVKFSHWYTEIQSFYIPQHCTNHVFSYTNEKLNQYLGICSDWIKNFDNRHNILKVVQSSVKSVKESADFQQ